MSSLAALAGRRLHSVNISSDMLILILDVHALRAGTAV